MTYVHSYRKARTKHKCVTCYRTIDPGETYLRGAAFGHDSPGGVYTWKECQHCQQLFMYLTRFYDEYEYSDELAMEWEPDTIEHLRIKALFRKKWRRMDGALYPAPVFEYIYDEDGLPKSYRLRIGES